MKLEVSRVGHLNDRQTNISFHNLSDKTHSSGKPIETGNQKACFEFLGFLNCFPENFSIVPVSSFNLYKLPNKLPMIINKVVYHLLLGSKT